jgi:pimeloyl-ACP methyl ester carboxylesterase
MRIQASAGRIYVDDVGISDCPVVFVHSLAGESLQWAEQLAHVRARGCGIAYDLRGHGRSDPPTDGDYSLEACADDLQAVLDAVGVDRAILVAHSLGGAIATVFAAAHPERVEGLLLVDSVGDQRLAPDEMQQFLVALDSQHYDQVIHDYWKQIAGNDPVIRERLMRSLDRTPKAAVVGMLWALQRTDLSQAITTFTKPKLAVVTPYNDFPFALHRIDPTMRAIVIEGTGHWLHMEKPDEFNAILEEFVARVTARAGNA